MPRLLDEREAVEVAAEGVAGGAAGGMPGGADNAGVAAAEEVEAGVEPA